MEKLRNMTLLGASLFTAGLPFFCCWTPTILIGLAGFMGLSSGLEWLHPVRPYLNGISFLTLGIIHYRAYRNSRVTGSKNNKDLSDCGCKQNTQSTTNNKWILWTITFFVIIITFINYLID